MKPIIAEIYRGTIAMGLKQFDNGQHSGDFCNALPWGGLANYEVNGVEIFYDEFLAHNKDLKDRNRILNNITNEAVNNLKAKGDDCP